MFSFVFFNFDIGEICKYFKCFINMEVMLNENLNLIWNNVLLNENWLMKMLRVFNVIIVL